LLIDEREVATEDMVRKVSWRETVDSLLLLDVLAFSELPPLYRVYDPLRDGEVLKEFASKGVSSS
jgi:hypothetical protein